jgi:nucleoside-diphosphate kinase
MVKPDGVQRAMVGQVISRLESKGLKLVAARFMRIDDDLASRHYGEHKGKAFYEPLIKYITSGPVLATVWEGKGAISTVRTLVGKTNPLEAAPGTIRGDYGMETGRNIIHASDSPASAEREINLFFTEDELLDYVRMDGEWVYE